MKNFIDWLRGIPSNPLLQGALFGLLCFGFAIFFVWVTIWVAYWLPWPPH